ncbi:alkaline phosphatase [Pelagicoccus sp. SDUM812003]|uniref:alkaline phosphatase n=1 Tax=Pelagicoccus sp. SDUM812003 TaxID=3041267 RepID=UPI00280DDD69|nr:alkaline phosphatase [Pelagicoccus sp. SDUM812003]MDQ8204271.1 alkaline phosphatase [Pelagicoccus sp. SDUM812003]
MSANPRLFALGSFALCSLVAGSEETPERWLAEGRAAIERSAELVPIERPAKNVILVVGDGMGISTVTAGRILEGQMRGETGEENWLSFERFPYTALSKTYNVDQQTPDSAGTMTAMITGAKTDAGVLSVDQRVRRGDGPSAGNRELFTFLEKAEIAGKATGIVTTARVTHATPGACYAHTPERNWECDAKVPQGAGVADIAAQLIEMPSLWAKRGYEQVDGPEVVFGGGRANFFPQGPIDERYSSEGDSGQRLDGRNLVQEWLSSRSNAAYIHDIDTFESLDVASVGHVLGLFENSHMRYEVDRSTDIGGEPSLAEMASKALDLLEKDQDGYFLMLEAGRIDHGHHAGNAYRALHDTVALSEAVRLLVERTNPEETLIIVTADHSHVFTMAGYPGRGNDILGMVADTEGRLSKDLLGLPYTTVGYQNGPGYLGATEEQPEGFKRYPHDPHEAEHNHGGRPDLRDACSDWDSIDGCDGWAQRHLQESAYPLNSETHGGEDVGIWAIGPYAHLLHGTVEQNVIFHLMDYASAWEVDDPFAGNRK